MFKTNFLTANQAKKLAVQHGTLLFVYSQKVLKQQAQAMLNVPVPYGLTVRYAMKANPHPSILRVLKEQGIKVDASSGYEAAYAIEQGFAASDILLTSQQLAHNLKELVERGVQFNATSLRQLDEYGKLFPGSQISVRLNPGIGSGHSNRTNVGGLASSFGIWHEYIPQLLVLADKHHLRVTRVHTHIGSGTDPAVWHEAVRMSLDLARKFPEATTVDLGGGFKVGRMDDESAVDMTVVGPMIAKQIADFNLTMNRKLHVELEPGTFLAANAGVLLASVEDIVDTGDSGYTFLKLNTGMNDILRPSMYGAQHPIAVLNNATGQQEYVVVGHNCESGDILTPAPGDPEALQSRLLNKAAIGDLVAIGGTGAYCAAMSAHGYNSYPNASEILV